VALLLGSAGSAASQVGPDALKWCKELAFSTEEDFVTQGPEPPDGNPIISDGDLLGPRCVVCARNADLMPVAWEIMDDLGLDAADVIDVDSYLVAFSTELDSQPWSPVQFTAGDLLVTNEVIIPNQVLTARWSKGQGVGYDIGLDGVQFVGDPVNIIAFLEAAATAQQPIIPPVMDELLAAFPDVDIWYSTEGTLGPVDAPGFLDGDLLSVRNGTIVASNDQFLPPSVPAGVPVRGVDFGLDAVAGNRTTDRSRLHFSTEILFDGEISFTDGDVLRMGNGVVATNYDLTHCFEPLAKELGLDALSLGIPTTPECTSRITKIGGVDVADISLVDGMVFPGAWPAINAPVPFGGRINFEGTICDDVNEFRVVYRKASSTDSWEPMPVPDAKNWKVKVDDIWPGPDCNAKQKWFSDGLGWFSGPDYRHLTEAALGGCNPGLSLTVWESTAAVAGPDELYEVVLETATSAGTFSDTMRIVQLDNTKPVVELEKVEGQCDVFGPGNMPLMATGRMTDTHFYKYQLCISGDGYSPVCYPPVTYWDDLADNVIDTGTTNWDLFQDLHEVTVYDLAASPVDCGYSVSLTGWDRTLVCKFTYPINHPARDVGTRHSSDSWGFKFVP
jgi:hypothetical protein